MDLPFITERPLPYQHNLTARPLFEIDLLVLHCTELPDLETARVYGERLLYSPSGTGNSGHFYVDRDGRVEQWVDPERIAHHVRGFNARSIGIELVNLGRYPDWLDSRHQEMTEPYPQLQIDALVTLVDKLRSSLPELRWIAGHADLDTERVAAENDSSVQIRRKLDPGPLFPWPQILQKCGLDPFPAQANPSPPRAPDRIL